eukprot:jgi/Tetstr1/434038/TSEL_023182.t1
MEKELRSQLAAEERARVEADILRRKRDKKSETTTSGNLCMRRAGPAHSSEPLPAVTVERSSKQQHGDVDAHGADGEEAGIVEEADLRLINLSSSKWDADMEKLVHMVLPYGNLMIKWPSVEDMLEGQGEELAAVGLSTTEDMISSTLDLKLVLQHRARLLLKEGLIKPGESLSIHLVADAT